jgi:hypothetical protein
MTPKKTQSKVSGGQPYLKAKNAWYLWVFIGANLAVFLSLVVSKAFVGSAVEHFWGRVTAKDGIIAVTIPLAAMVFSGALGDTAKARLVFWRWRHPLPGCRVFTELLNTDPRIDVPALKKKLGRLPKEPQAQNALWYGLYRARQAAPTIFEAHRLYLLTRDMATISAVLVVLFSIGVVASSIERKIAVLYSGGLIVQYLLVASAARNYGVRFVLNVLTEESQSA